MGNKRKETWVKGRLDIEQVIKNLNTYFAEEGAGYSIYKLHPLLKTMEISEKARYNTSENRTGKAPFTTAMGLDCHIEGPENGKVLSLFLRYSNDWFFYIKLPTKVKSWIEIQDHLETLRHYHVLFVARPKGIVQNTYTAPTPLKNIIDHVPYSLTTSAGNRNQLQFKYNPSSLLYRKPGQGGLLVGPLLNQIKEAMKNENLLRRIKSREHKAN